MTDRLLSAVQAAAYIGVRWRTLRDWHTAGKGPPSLQPVKRGALRYRREDLDAFLKAVRNQPPVPPPPLAPPRWTRLTDAQWAAVDAALHASKAGALHARLTLRKGVNRPAPFDRRAFIDKVLAAAALGYWKTWDGQWAASLSSIAQQWQRKGLWPVVFKALAGFPGFPFSLAANTVLVLRLPGTKRYRALSVDVESWGPLNTRAIGCSLAHRERSRGKPLPKQGPTLGSKGGRLGRPPKPPPD